MNREHALDRVYGLLLSLCDDADPTSPATCDHDIAAATMLFTHQRWAFEDIPLWSALNAAQMSIDRPGDAAVAAILKQFVPDLERRERISAACASAGELGDQWAFLTYAP